MRKTLKQKYRLLLLAFLSLDLLAAAFLGFRKLNRRIPDEILVEKGSSQNLEQTLACPLVSFSDAVETSGDGGYLLETKLLGTIPFKTVKVVPVDGERVSLSGENVGIYLATKGVLIVDTGEILTQEGVRYSPARDLVKTGDYIVGFNEQEISSKKELMECLASLDQDTVELQILRDDKKVCVPLNPVQDGSGAYKLGIWVRDDTQGIGTLTYVDSEGNFGALGHGISDVDTGNLLSIQKGLLYQAEILRILKGSKGNPGELSGLIRYDDRRILGEIEKNTANGIYGRLSVPVQSSGLVTQETYPVAYKQELTEGPVKILCHVGKDVRLYDGEITHIDLNHEDTNKSFVIRVTDPGLLEETGGIVQGLSGSPVIQNGKFAGAITHVFVQDATSGYGIFAETMLKEQKSLGRMHTGS